MKRKENKCKRIFFALLLAVLYLAFYILGGPNLSPAGDINIAGHLASQTAPGFYFISPYIAFVLHALYQLFPMVNWWVMFSLASIFIGGFVGGFLVLSCTENQFYNLLLLILFYGLYWYGIGEQEVNFTQTAAIYTVCGTACLLYNGRDGRKSSVPVTIAGAVLLGTGWLVRWKAALFCMPFVCMVSLSLFLQDLHGQEEKQKHFPWRLLVKNRGVLYIVAVSATAIFLWLGYGALNPEYKEYYQANKLREDIYDYQTQYPSYEENKDLYQEIGVDQSALKMIYGNIVGDGTYFTSEQLKKIKNIKNPSRITRENIQRVIEKAMENPGCTFLTGLFLFVMLIIYGKKILYALLLQTVSIVICGAYLSYIGRVEWRVLAGIFFSCVLHMTVFATTCKEKKCKLSYVLQAVLITALFIFCFKPAVKNYSFLVPKTGVRSEKCAALADYINEHPENVYVMSTKDSRYYVGRTLWSSPPKGYCRNLVATKAHFYLGQKELLSSYGIEYLFEEMLYKDYIICDYNKKIYKYILKHYDSHVTASVVDELGEIWFVRYMKPITINWEPESNKLHVMESDFFKGGNRFKVTFPNSFGDGTFYLHIKKLDTNETFTYLCKSGEGTIIVDGIMNRNIICISGELRACLVKESGEEYVYCADVSEAVLRVFGILK